MPARKYVDKNETWSIEVTSDAKKFNDENDHFNTNTGLL